MAWIQIEAGARDHPKMIKLARDCNVTVAHACGTVMSLWLWCITHAPDGDLSSYDAEDIELAAGWEGDTGVWYKSAVARRLIDVVDGCAQVHDWQDHTSSWKEAQRAREWRASKKKRAPQSRTRARSSHDSAPDQTRTEKRREEREEEVKQESPATTTSGDACEIVGLWNRSVPQAQRVPPDGTPAIDRAYSGLVNACPPVSHGEILGAVENYRLALSVPNSQAHAHSLGGFLRRENVDKYLPGNFNVANYDRSRFDKEAVAAAETPEQKVARLKAKGLL